MRSLLKSRTVLSGKGYCYSFPIERLEKNGLSEKDIIPIWGAWRRTGLPLRKLDESLYNSLQSRSRLFHRPNLFGWTIPFFKVPRNIIVTAGKNHIADLLANVGGNDNLGWCDVGTSTQDPVVGDTDLIAAISGAREAVDDDFRTNNIATLSTLFTAGQKNGTWAEAGSFFAVSGDDMAARALFSPTVAHTGSTADLVDWDITVG